MDRTAISPMKPIGITWGILPHLEAQSLELPVGHYTLIVDNGLEFRRIESAVDLMKDQTVRLLPERWTHMASKGWWSGDFHVHRPPEDAELLLMANDLNFAVFFTMWNDYNFWEGKELPADPSVRADCAAPCHVDERRRRTRRRRVDDAQPREAHWLGIKPERWYPQGHVYVDQAKAQGAWFDSEKPFWWESPVMAALEPSTPWASSTITTISMGPYAQEAWGRPRDQKLYPGSEGFANYCQGSITGF